MPYLIYIIDSFTWTHKQQITPHTGTKLTNTSLLCKRHQSFSCSEALDRTSVLCLGPFLNSKIDKKYRNVKYVHKIHHEKDTGLQRWNKEVEYLLVSTKLGIHMRGNSKFPSPCVSLQMTTKAPWVLTIHFSLSYTYLPWNANFLCVGQNQWNLKQVYMVLTNVCLFIFAKWKIQL